jgi:hypothetical protein
METGGVDDLKDFGLAVLSLLATSVQPQETDLFGPAIDDLAAYAAALEPSSLFRSWSNGSSRPAAPLITDGSFDPCWDTVGVDGGNVIVTASSSRSAATSAARALDRGESFWQSSVDAQSSWLQLELERPAYLLYLDLEWKWSATVSCFRKFSSCNSCSAMYTEVDES